jgi:hypothetical protein
LGIGHRLLPVDVGNLERPFGSLGVCEDTEGGRNEKFHTFVTLQSLASVKIFVQFLAAYAVLLRIAMGLPQQRLNFWPEPQGQGSLRPIFGAGLETVSAFGLGVA